MKKSQSDFYKRLVSVFGTDNGAEIARKLKVERQTIYKWRDGKLPSRTQLLKISQLTGKSTQWLLPEKEMFTSLSDKDDSGIKSLAHGTGSEDTANEKLTTRSIETPMEPDDVSVPLTGTISADTQQIVRNKESLTVKVPNFLVDSDQFQFQIEGNGWSQEGLHDGDLLLATKPNGALEGRIVIAQLPNEKIIVRRYRQVGSMVHFAPIEGRRPVIRAPEDEIRIEYIVTIITRSVE